MSASDVAAWWGAIISTLLLMWSIYSWGRAKTILKVSVATNMRITTAGGILAHIPTLVIATVSNIGEQPTTITHVVVYAYKSWWHKLLGRVTMTGVVPMPGLHPNLPFVLEPGKQFNGQIEQTEELEQLSQTGRLYCGVLHSGSEKPALRRVVIRRRT